jgi:hypothetical protein
MLWTGFFAETDENTFEGSFGALWCADDGCAPGVIDLSAPLNGQYFPRTLLYDETTDTISGGEGLFVGTRQRKVKNVESAIKQLAKGTYPASPGPFDPSCT